MTRDYAAISRYNEEQLGKDRKSRMSQVAMYADTAHFVYELLQNADDAGAAEIDFLLRPTQLVVEHNGKPFTEENVRAISYFGKGKTDVTAIGRFGLGFKSVFAYTATPSIHSDNDDFELIDLYSLRGASRPRDLGAGRTRFVLPFDHLDRQPVYIEPTMLKGAVVAYGEIAGKLRQMGGRTLLFTNSLREIGWTDGHGSGWYGRSDAAVPGGGRESTIRANHETDQHFLVFERAIAWPDEHGRPVERRPVAIAFELDGPLADGGRTTGPDRQKLWVFFPTDKDTRTGLILQGPFRTTPARDNVPAADAFNQFLVREAAALFRDSLQSLRGLGLIDAELLRRLPIDVADFPEGELLRPIYDIVRDELRGEPLLPTSRQTYLPATHVKLARGQKLVELFEGAQLGALFGDGRLEWLDPAITADRYPQLHRYLTGVKQNPWSDTWLVEPLVADMEVDIESIATRMTARFMEAQSDEWVRRFYRYLYESRGVIYKHFVNRPILRLEDGSHVAPWKDALGTPAAYLPTGADLGLPTVKRALADDPKVRPFLVELRLAAPDLSDEVINQILPKYTGSGDLDPGAWGQDLIRIVGALTGTAGAKRDRLVAALRGAPWLMCTCAADENPVWSAPGEAYIPLPELRRYFAPTPRTRFLSDGSPQSFVDVFVREFHVATTPRWTSRSTDWQGHVVLSRSHGYHRRGLDGFDPDWAVEGLEAALGLQDAEVAQYAWNRIALPNVARIQGVVERSSRKTYEDSRRETKISVAGQLLRDLAWLPTSDGTFSRPRDLYLTDLPEGFDQASPQAKRLSEVLGMRQPESVKALETLAHGNLRLKGLIERIALEDLDDVTIEKLEKLLPKEAKLVPAGSFKDAVAAIHRTEKRTSEETGVTGGDPVRNPERYGGKLKERLDNAREEDSQPRTVTFKLVREKSDTKDARVSLYQEYEGRCQVSGETFTKANGQNYFEAVTLVPTQGTAYLNNAGNMLCLSADMAARFMHASFEWIDDLGQKIDRFRPEREGGELSDRQLRVRLGGEERVITFTERHFLKLRALWQSSGEDA